MTAPQTPPVRTEVQVLHLKDDIDPIITGVTGQTEWSVDPWLCLVEVLQLPTPIATDLCNPDNLHFIINGPAGVQIINGVAYNVPKGKHIFTYYAKDCTSSFFL